jgi:hypothetical protein
MRQTSHLENGDSIEYTRSIYNANQRFESIYNPTISSEDDLYPDSDIPARSGGG